MRPSIQRLNQRWTKNPSILSCLNTNIDSQQGAIEGDSFKSLYVEIAPQTEILPKFFMCVRTAELNVPPTCYVELITVLRQNFNPNYCDYVIEIAVNTVRRSF